MFFFFRKKKHKQGEPFSCVKLRLLIDLLHIPDKEPLSIRDIADKTNKHRNFIFKHLDWLTKERILIYVGKITVKRNVGFGTAHYTVDGYIINKERIDQIIFDKWNTRILWDRAEEYMDRPEYK